MFFVGCIMVLTHRLRRGPLEYAGAPLRRERLRGRISYLPFVVFHVKLIPIMNEEDTGQAPAAEAEVPLKNPEKPKKVSPLVGRKPNIRSKVNRGDTQGGAVSLRLDPMNTVAERDDPAFKKFSDFVGGKEGLKELAAWSENPKAQALLSLLDDARFKTYGIKALAKRCGMTLPELCNLFREKKFLEMYLTFFSGVPEIAAGAVEDAKATLDVCPLCSGDTTITRNNKTLPCPKCGASGRVRVPGDKEARRDVFKAVGVHKDSGTNITQIGNVTVEGVDDFEVLMKNAKSVPITIKEKDGQEQVKEAEIIEG